jgi:hypothetical protein
MVQVSTNLLVALPETSDVAILSRWGTIRKIASLNSQLRLVCEQKPKTLVAVDVDWTRAAVVFDTGSAVVAVGTEIAGRVERVWPAIITFAIVRRPAGVGALRVNPARETECTEDKQNGY